MTLQLFYHIDEYKKQEDGSMKRVWKYETTDKNEFDTIRYNLGDRVIKTYKKMKEV
mgnify:CR=1 FL=1